MTFALDLQVSAQGVEPEGSDEGAKLREQMIQPTPPMRVYRYRAHSGLVLGSGAFMVQRRAAAAAV